MLPTIIALRSHILIIKNQTKLKGIRPTFSNTVNGCNLLIMGNNAIKPRLDRYDISRNAAKRLQ